MKFRNDINALRALAVTAVVLFHYKVDFVPGGFVGVDVFFVISGYLMTSIIMGRLAKDRFSVWEFYYDRAKRIVPGLLGLCFCLLAAGYLLLEPTTYHYLGSTSISALLFFSNFRFWEATGYFDQDSNTKWLLHTWSLSVEWQFYLIYPIILMLLHRFERTRRFIVPILWSMAALSVLLCIWSTKLYPASAFYLLPQRAWEMLAGGIVALQFKNSEQRYSWPLLASGLALIGISLVYFDKNMAWPSYSALLPVVGTCLVIAANRANGYAFRNAIVQTVGKWSYSIYLWHWPVAVAAIYFDFTTTTPQKIICEILILAAIITTGGLLLALAKRISNTPFGQEKRPRLVLGGAALALTVGLAVVVTVNDGLGNRMPGGQGQFALYTKAATDWGYPRSCNGMDEAGNLQPCQLGSPQNPGVLFIGNSFAMQIFSRFSEYAKTHPESSFTFLTSPGCPPLTGIRMVHDRLNCNGFIDKALQFAESRSFKRIVLVSLWYDYFIPFSGEICFVKGESCTGELDRVNYYDNVDGAFSQLASRLLELRKRGSDVVIVSPTPFGKWNVPAELAKRKFLQIDTTEVEYFDRDRFENFFFPIKSRLMSLAASVGGSFVDPANYLCDAHRCPTTDRDGAPLYRDRSHFRATAVLDPRFRYLDEVASINTRLTAVPISQRKEP